jgi:tetratricopeptide (TPR) repeat protein
MRNKKDLKNQLKNWFIQIWKSDWNSLNKIGILVTILTGIPTLLGWILGWIDTKWITWVVLLLFFFLAGLLFRRCWNILHKKSPRYSQKPIRFARIGLFVIPCIIIFIPSGWFILQSLPAKEAIILVANFDGDKNIKVDSLIGDELEKVTKSNPKIKILYSDEIITLKQGREKAEKIGKDRDATLVIWGWQENNGKETVYDARFTVLKPTGEFYLGKSLMDGNPQIIPASEPEEFRLKHRYAKNISFDALFGVAITQASLHNWDKAIKLIDKKVLPKIEEPLDRSRVFDALTLFYLMKGDYEKALENNNEALYLQGDDSNASTLNSRGLIFWARNDYKQASTYFKKALQLQPKNAQYISNLGGILAIKGNYNQALEKFDETLKLQPNSIDALSNRSTILYIQGDYKEAIDELTKIINKAEAENYDSLKVNNYYLNRAEAYCKQNNFEPCIADYSHVINSMSLVEKISLNIGLKQVKPKKIMQLAEAYNNRGLNYKEKGELGLAIADFNKAIKLLTPFQDKPINPRFGEEFDSNLTLAHIYNNRGITYDKRSEFAPTYYSRSTGYSKRTLLNFAINDFNKALKLAEFKAAYLNRAEAYISQSQYDLAIADLNKLMSWSYLDRAEAYKNQGDLKSSLADYDQSIKLDSNNYYAYVNRGNFLLINSIKLQSANIFDTLNKALQNFNTAIDIKPEDANTYRYLSNVYYKWSLYLTDDFQNNKLDKQKTLESAINLLTKAIDLERDNELNTINYMLRGKIYSEIGNLNLAEKDFNKAIEISSNCISHNCEAYIELGKIYEQMGKTDLARLKFNHAINYFTKIINFGYNNPDDYFWRGSIYNEMGNFELALTDYSKAIALNPNNENYQLSKATLILKRVQNRISDKKDKSQETFNKMSIEEFKKADALLQEFKNKLNISQDIATQNTSEVIDNKNKNEDEIAEYNENIAEVQLRRGIVYSKKGDQQNAISDFKQVLELAKNSMIRQEAQIQLQQLGIKYSL